MKVEEIIARAADSWAFTGVGNNPSAQVAALDRAKTCLAALKDAGYAVVPVEPDPATQWHPIDTAPKDGTQVLVWSPGMKETYKAAWEDWCGHWQPEYAEVQMLDDEDTAPTHWMTLPEEPK